MSQDATRLGTVEDVEGATVRALLRTDSSVGLSFVEGIGYRIGQVGSFVRIPLGYDELFGVVAQVGASAAPDRDDGQQVPHGNRWMTIQLIGEAARDHELRRGISRLPTVGDEVHLVSKDELTRIYGRPESPEYLRIGTVVGSDAIPSLVDLNKLVSRHSALVGSTGAGKSTTVAGLLYNIASAEDLSSPRMLVLDLHGEYAASMGSFGDVFSVDPDPSSSSSPLFVPYWALTFEELVSVTFGELHSDTDRGAIIDRILTKKRESFRDAPVPGISEDEINVDTPVPFSIHQLWFDLYLEVVATHLATGNQGPKTVAYELDEDDDPIDPGDPMEVRPPKTMPHDRSSDPKVYLSQSPLNIRRQIEAVEYRLRDERFSFLFRPGAWLPDTSGVPESDLDVLLKQWLGNDAGVSVLDLSGIPAEVVDTLVGALLRIVYDALFWARNLPEGGRERPLLIVLEEAHSYLRGERAGSASRAVRRIAKEGRKYGIGIMLVSQRPTEIDPTILSQCGTVIAMRLTNSKDRNRVTSSVSDNLSGLLSMLPVLQTGEAIVVGEAVRFPTRTTIEPPPHEFRPDSQDPVVYSPILPGGWNQDSLVADYSEVLELWRRNSPESLRIVDFETDGEPND